MHKENLPPMPFREKVAGCRLEQWAITRNLTLTYTDSEIRVTRSNLPGQSRSTGNGPCMTLPLNSRHLFCTRAYNDIIIADNRWLRIYIMLLDACFAKFACTINDTWEVTWSALVRAPHPCAPPVPLPYSEAPPRAAQPCRPGRCQLADGVEPAPPSNGA